MIFLTQVLNCLTIDRVIVSSDANPLYLEFWPIVADTWKKIVGIKPTLVLVAHQDVIVDKTIGDVIRFEPIQGISTALQAQLIRLLAPAYFEDEVCIISDMDMIPLAKHFFIDAVKGIADDNFVIYSKLPPLEPPDMVPSVAMCYVAAKGKIFKQIFGLKSIIGIHTKMQEWANLDLGWCTDQVLLYKYLVNWPDCNQSCILLNQDYNATRVCRHRWGYDKKLLKSSFYRDAHLLRPYSQYKDEIDLLKNDLLDLFYKNK